MYLCKKYIHVVSVLLCVKEISTTEHILIYTLKTTSSTAFFLLLLKVLSPLLVGGVCYMIIENGYALACVM